MLVRPHSYNEKDNLIETHVKDSETDLYGLGMVVDLENNRYFCSSSLGDEKSEELIECLERSKYRELLEDDLEGRELTQEGLETIAKNMEGRNQPKEDLNQNSSSEESVDIETKLNALNNPTKRIDI